VAQILAVVEQYFDAATLMALHATVSCAGANDGKLPAASHRHGARAAADAHRQRAEERRRRF
jgi:hypothetical protein